MKKLYLIPTIETTRLHTVTALMDLSSEEIKPADPNDPIPDDADSKRRSADGWGDLW